MATATTPARGHPHTPSVSLYERATALATIDVWIEEHADEIVANGGELTPELAQLLEQAEGDLATKLERVTLKVREFVTNAEIAKGTKQAISAQAAAMLQRERMWENAAKSLKKYAGMCLEAANLSTIKTTLGAVRIQKNPETLTHTHTSETLLAIHDTAGKPHALLPYLTVTRSATLDTKALLAAMQAREAELIEEATSVEANFDDATCRRLEQIDDTAAFSAEYDKALAAQRATHVATELQREFPGCMIGRSSHVRIA